MSNSNGARKPIGTMENTTEEIDELCKRWYWLGYEVGRMSKYQPKPEEGE